jgi:hypothetical protein
LRAKHPRCRKHNWIGHKDFPFGFSISQAIARPSSTGLATRTLIFRRGLALVSSVCSLIFIKPHHTFLPNVITFEQTTLGVAGMLNFILNEAARQRRESTPAGLLLIPPVSRHQTLSRGGIWDLPQQQWLPFLWKR